MLLGALSAPCCLAELDNESLGVSCAVPSRAVTLTKDHDLRVKELP